MPGRELPPDYDVSKVLAYWQEHPGITVKELHKAFPMVSESALYNSAIRAGVEFNSRQQFTPPDNEEQLIAMLRGAGWNKSKLAKQLGMKTPNPVKDWCAAFGVDAKKLQREERLAEKNKRITTRPQRPEANKLPGESSRQQVNSVKSASEPAGNTRSVEPDPNAGWLSELKNRLKSRAPKYPVTVRDVRASKLADDN